jgi:hypothetical protein
VTLQKNLKRGVTYKVPVNLLEPKEVLKAKLKNRSNTIKKAHMILMKEAEEKRKRLESQARFAAMVREARAKNAAPAAPSFLLKDFENNNSWATKTIKRGPGVRGTANSIVRKANLLRMSHMASKANGTPAPPRKPLGKFWKKEGTNSNSNSD